MLVKRLGRGIEAIFQDNLDKTEELMVQMVKLSMIRPNPYQPRQTFDEEALEELVQSIQQHGIIQPLIVRKSIRGFEIVAGERRFRAAKKAGLKEVPVVSKPLTDEEMMEYALIENLQREDLNPVEEAKAYLKLMENLHLTQEEVAKRVGKSRPYVANYLRILSLPQSTLARIEDGSLSMGHGRALLALKTKKQMEQLAEETVKNQWSVRKLEQVVQQLIQNVSRETKKEKLKPSVFVKEQERYLQEQFGTAVHIKQGKKKGKIEIEFMSDDDLERILQLLRLES